MLQGMARSLEKRLDEAREIVNSFNDIPIRIITHNDADGISSGAIVHLALEREGFKVHTRCVKQLEEKIIVELADEKPEIIIFSDLGSGQLENIEKYLKETEVIIIDHHEPQNADFSGFQLNAHKHGIDGASEISGSGMAYLFARSLREENKDLAALAIVGAVGDLQDTNGKLLGVNRLIAGEGVKDGILRIEKDLRIYGRQTRPLYKALEYTTDPIIPGVSGSESSSIVFLKELEIPIKKGEGFTMLADLNDNEKKLMANALVLKMVENNVPIKIAESIIGEVITLLREEKRTPLRDAREFATLLNSCGKNEKYGIGLAVAMGEREDLYTSSLDMLTQHREYIGYCYSWISENIDKITDYGNIYTILAGTEINENVIGTIAGMVLNSRTLPELKPVIALAETDEDEIKVSSRANRELVERGINLGKAMHYASEKVGGEGGGHDIAAGAKIKKGREKEFLEYVEEMIADQLGG